MTLKQYCKEHSITMKELAKITGVSEPLLYKIDKEQNTTVETINKIYNGTKEKFGVGLPADLYLKIHQ